MVRWEYCVLNHHKDGPVQLRILDTSGGELHSIKNKFIVLAQLGLEGWELVSHTLSSEIEQYTFKRPTDKQRIELEPQITMKSLFD